MEFDIKSGEKAVKEQLRSALVNARYGLAQAVENVRIRNHVVSVDGVVDLKDVYDKLDAQIDALTDVEALAAEKAQKEAAAAEKAAKAAKDAAADRIAAAELAETRIKEREARRKDNEGAAAKQKEELARRLKEKGIKK